MTNGKTWINNLKSIQIFPVENLNAWTTSWGYTNISKESSSSSPSKKEGHQHSKPVFY